MFKQVRNDKDHCDDKYSAQIQCQLKLSEVIHKFVKNLLLGGLEILEVSPVEVELLQPSSHFTLVEVGSPTVQIPGPTNEDPEEITGDGVGEGHACCDWLHDIPGEGDVGTVL